VSGSQLLEAMTRAFLIAAGILFIASGMVSVDHPMNAGLFASAGLGFIISSRFVRFPK
jgi:hypothetical protein